MEQRWGFLAPWCFALKERLVYEVLACDILAWDAQQRQLLVYVPGRLDKVTEDSILQYPLESDYLAHFHKIREALLLLAAVAHFDKNAFKFLLSKFAGVHFGCEGEEKFEQELSAKFVVVIDLYKVVRDADQDTFDSDLVQFCGVYHHENPSDEFETALERIARLNKLDPSKSAIDVVVPVRVYYRHGHESESDPGPLTLLRDYQVAQKEIRESWEPFNQKNVVVRRSLRPFYLLKPLVADLDGVSVSPEMAKTISTLVRENVWFSRLTLDAYKDPDTVVDEESWLRALGHLMAGVFNRTRQSPELLMRSELEPPTRLLQISVMQLCCLGWVGVDEFASLCSAVVVNQTTRRLTLELSIDPENGTNSKQAWKWLAYAFFSKRAREHSSLESLALTSTGICSMSRADIEAFAVVVASEYPEEELFDCPRGIVKSREAALNRGCPIHWCAEENDRSASVDRILRFDLDGHLVRTFSDDGKSEWVNVLVPGFGRCHVQRIDLNFIGACSADTSSYGLTSLQLHFDRDNAPFMDGLSGLLEVVGRQLKHLALNEIGLDTSLFREHCPNLVDMTLDSPWVESRLDLKDYHKTRHPPPVLNYELDNIPDFVSGLCDSTNSLTNCLSRLRVRLNTVSNWFGKSAVQDTVKTLLQMLEANQTIEYLDVIAPPEFHDDLGKFKRYHLQPIHRTLQPLSVEKKSAFLSVMAPMVSSTESTKRRECKKAQPLRFLPQLDEQVLSLVFSFAAPPVIRKVYFRKAALYDWLSNQIEEPL